MMDRFIGGKGSGKPFVGGKGSERTFVGGKGSKTFVGGKGSKTFVGGKDGGFVGGKDGGFVGGKDGGFIGGFVGGFDGEFVGGKDSQRVNFYDFTIATSGYGILGGNIFRILVKHGCNVNRSMSYDLGSSDISLQLSMPEAFNRTPSRINIGYTMFEASRIPEAWVSLCNIMDRLFVPLKSNVEIFKTCGVNIPIDVIPIGIDETIFDPAKYSLVGGVGEDESGNVYKFLMINDGQSRKNNELVIKAFNDEFEREILENKVSLVIRSQVNYTGKGKGIIWITDYLDDPNLAILIKSCDCCISASSGEAGDIPILAGMAMEKPVIVSRELAHSEYIIDYNDGNSDRVATRELCEANKILANGFFIETEKIVPAFEDPQYNDSYLKQAKGAMWIEPSGEDLKKKMRFVYENRDIAIQVGKNAREYILKNRTLDICIEPMIKIFDDILKERIDKVFLVSSWNANCGIANYSNELLGELENIYPNHFEMKDLRNEEDMKYMSNVKKLVHFQHEFSLIPDPPDIKGKVIITWHTIPELMPGAIKYFEAGLDVVAHIVTSEEGRKYMETTKDVFAVVIGSKLMPNITKDEARKRLNLNEGLNIGFAFGFQTTEKNYNRLIEAARNTNIHIIISGSPHNSGFKSDVQDKQHENEKQYEHVTFIGKYLTDEEIDLYALASDILLFDYNPQSHYSSSSAMHRTVGAGRPVICNHSNHFTDIREVEDGALKFHNIQELENCIRTALERKTELGNNALEYAKRTSREVIARRHLEIYRKYVAI